MNAATKIEAAAPLVYTKIAAVQAELAKVGISKSRRNQQQGYNFRGIDEVYAALSPLLASNGLVIVPRVLERQCIEGTTRKGDPLFRVTVRAEFDFIAAEDGSIHTASTYGEAMDSADKATNKAMSAAYKYAAFMTFAIPTEGDNDADASHPEPASSSGSGQGQNGGRQVSPDTGPATLRQQLEDSVADKPATKDLPFPQGPAKNKTELKAMGRALWREIEGCGDDIEMSCLLGEPTNVALVQQIKETLPAWWDGYEKDGEVHDGLCDVIAKKTKEFTAQALENMR